MFLTVFCFCFLEVVFVSSLPTLIGNVSALTQFTPGVTEIFQIFKLLFQPQLMETEGNYCITQARGFICVVIVKATPPNHQQVSLRQLY